MVKIKKIKRENNKSEDEQEISRFIKILLIVVVFILGIYFFTSIVVKKEYNIKKDITEGQVSTNRIIVGSILNRPHEDYYVLVYNSTSNKAALYETLISVYESKKDSLRIYAVDLNNHLNEKYSSEKSNPIATKIADFKFGEITLLKIKDKKVNKYIEEYGKIKNELGI
ncbi:MAG: hypothetical protein IJO33_04805 [Bacilli bacterium]|nr:hypothetical protein [Bacilli bacterium]